MSLLVEEF